MREIKINDGTKEYVLKNEFGKELCKLHFRPTDISLFSRLKDAADKLNAVMKPLADLDISSDGTPESESGIEKLQNATSEVISIFNKLLNSDDAGEIFKCMNPFSAVNGQFFCEVVISVISDIIADETEKESQATQQRLQKYLE